MCFPSVPIGFSIGLSVVAYVFLLAQSIWAILIPAFLLPADSFPLMAIPFFILSGMLMEGGDLSDSAVNWFASYYLYPNYYASPSKAVRIGRIKSIRKYWEITPAYYFDARRLRMLIWLA